MEVVQEPLVMPEYDDPSLRRRYVVLNTGVGPNWVRGDVVMGKHFFSDDRHRIQRVRKVLNKSNGQFEHEVIEERTLNEMECLAGINRLLSLNAIRPATEVEAQLSKVELEKTTDIHELSSNEQKLAQQESEINELKRQMAAMQDRNVVARAITETKELQAAHPSGPLPQAPPGGRPAQRVAKAMAAVE